LRQRRVPVLNADKEQTLASMQRIGDLLAKNRAQPWINHDKSQSDRQKHGPNYYD
jgi:N-acyl homoserine lactone hydrolase